MLLVQPLSAAVESFLNSEQLILQATGTLYGKIVLNAPIHNLKGDYCRNAYNIIVVRMLITKYLGGQTSKLEEKVIVTL